MPIYDVFISYRRSDGAELAAVVANALRVKGLSVFFDTEEIKSGEDFTLRIENALRQAPNYLLIATPDVFKFRTNEKDWVLEEMKIACENYAHNLDKNRMFTLVVPQHVYRDVDRNDPPKGKRQVPVALPKAETWPAEVFDLSKPNRIQLKSNLPDEKELREILESVTRVTHHNMWNAGHRWLQENRQPGRRFASLDISKTIFPHALSMDVQEDEEDEEFPSMVQAQQDPSAKPEGEKLPLFDALTKTENHIYLVGEGGIGKTTSLIHIMERAYQNRAYSEEAQVPLFVELSKAPDTAGRLYANGKSTFIYRAIYRLIRQDRTVKQVTGAEVEETEEAFIADPQTAVTPVKALLANWNKPPQYLLLLDGLNEVSRTELVIKPTENGKETGEPDIHKTVYDMIVEEINDIMKTCPNVQIVLTGRADDGAVQGKNITRWQLTGIDDESIRTYLGGKVPQNEIEAIMGNRVLLDTLRIPLFLTMYIRLKEKAGITTQGEILHTFFSEKGKQLGDYDLPYSMRNRLGQVEKELDRSAKGKPNLRLTAPMQFFMIDFLLAALGRYMEKNNLFSVTSHQVEEVIRPILEDTAPTSVCGRFGEQAFPKYKKKGSLSSTSSVAEQLKALIGTGNGAARQFCLLASSVLGILVDDGKYNYSFIHQHVRDYFAALHVMNALWIGVVCSWTNREAAYAFLNSELAEKPLGFTVRQMLGEAAGEHHNKPWQDEEGNWHYNVPDKTKPHNRNLIPLAMDVYRGHFDERNSYALWNLIQVLKEVRQDLCGEDFSRLDLTMIRLNKHHPGKRGCTANFTGAKLQRELFMPMGHADTVHSAVFSPDGKRIVTASDDGTAKIWDAETLLELGTLKGGWFLPNFAAYSPDGKRIVTASWDETAKIWDAKTFQELGTLDGHTDSVNVAAYSLDGKRIVTASDDGTAKIWDAKSFRELGTLKGHS
ncbi:MAG: TIR domain-containing protein, partial [Clostridia bacterium]|nr:TIR domain-containing protein [Clostridia bacterium]